MFFFSPANPHNPVYSLTLSHTSTPRMLQLVWLLPHRLGDLVSRRGLRLKGRIGWQTVEDGTAVLEWTPLSTYHIVGLVCPHLGSCGHCQNWQVFEPHALLCPVWLCLQSPTIGRLEETEEPGAVSGRPLLGWRQNCIWLCYVIRNACPSQAHHGKLANDTKGQCLSPVAPAVAAGTLQIALGTAACGLSPAARRLPGYRHQPSNGYQSFCQLCLFIISSVEHLWKTKTYAKAQQNIYI